MADLEPLTRLLACPACHHGPLDASPRRLQCPGCRRSFPLLDGIPWLFADPTPLLSEWGGRLHLLLAYLSREAALHRQALESTTLPDVTRQRLLLVGAAYADQAVRLRELLAPLGVAARQERHEVHMALGTQLPLSQGLTNYYSNIHRDWAWGAAENAASLACVSEALKPGGAPRRLLVLGSGAGRLAYDLHQSLAPEMTVALDFNPLLAAVARRAAAGIGVDLYEFPIAPRSIDDHAVLRHLVAPSPAQDGLHFVLADALAAPFAPGSFDAVLTPWFVDIVPDDLPTLMRRINGLLAPGGRWICFGSLAWSDRTPAQCYSLEELLALLPRAGFSVTAASETEMPYMRSPASRHARIETVITLAATKRREVEAPQAAATTPVWLQDLNQPVPALPGFREQSLSTRVYAFIMAMIDGERSVRDMVQLMEQQQLMPSADAEPAIVRFLTRMHADAQRRANF